MAAYRRVYDSRHLQADCQEPRLGPDPVIEYGLRLPFLPVENTAPTVEGEVLSERIVADGLGHELGKQVGVTLHRGVLKTRHLADLESNAHRVTLLHSVYSALQHVTR